MSDTPPTTDQDTQTDQPKPAVSKIFTAFAIGLLVGVVIYNAVNGGSVIFTILPLLMAYVAFIKRKQQQE